MAYKNVSLYFLSERDKIIIKHLAAGKTHREIGAEMNLSYRSISKYVSDMHFELDAINTSHFMSILYERHYLVATALPYVPLPEENTPVKSKRKRYISAAGTVSPF